MLAIATAIFAASVASAQLGGVSASCLTSAASLITNQNATTCLAAAGLLPILSLPSSSSVVPVLNNYLTQFCPAPTCSNATLLSIASTVETGCASDLSQLGVQNGTLSTGILYFPAVKNIACLQLASNNSYCLVNTLTSIQNVLDTNVSVGLATSLLMGNLSAVTSVLPALANNQSRINSTFCTDCNKAIFTQVMAFQNSTLPTTVNATNSLVQQIGMVCGASFLNGSLPTTIRNGSGVNATTTANGTSPSGSASATARSAGWATASVSTVGVAALFMAALAVVV